jgi:hypothetical protein
MAPTTGAVDGLWVALQGLPRESRGEFLARLLADATLREEIEDLLDLELAEERSAEPVRPLEEVLAEIRKRRRRHTRSSSAARLSAS